MSAQTFPYRLRMVCGHIRSGYGRYPLGGRWSHVVSLDPEVFSGGVQVLEDEPADAQTRLTV